jgi:hypothetical protein
MTNWTSNRYMASKRSSTRSHGGWTFEIDCGEAGDKFKLDELLEAEAQLPGRVTYEGFAAGLVEDDRRGRLSGGRRASGAYFPVCSKVCW